MICTCENCGKELHKNPHRMKRTPRHYCSRACYYAYLDKQRTGNLTATCTGCGGLVTGIPEQRMSRNEQHFCSRECWRKHQRQQQGVPCEHCGALVPTPPHLIAKGQKRYCDMGCYGAWRKTHFKAARNPNWRGKGTTNQYKSDYGPSWRKQRKAALQRDGHACQHCGTTRSINGYALDIHHITPFVSFGYVRGENRNDKIANELANLTTLCRTCHRAVENSGASALRGPLHHTTSSGGPG